MGIINISTADYHFSTDPIHLEDAETKGGIDRYYNITKDWKPKIDKSLPSVEDIVSIILTEINTPITSENGNWIITIPEVNISRLSSINNGYYSLPQAINIPYQISISPDLIEKPFLEEFFYFFLIKAVGDQKVEINDYLGVGKTIVASKFSFKEMLAAISFMYDITWLNGIERAEMAMKANNQLAKLGVYDVKVLEPLIATPDCILSQLMPRTGLEARHRKRLLETLKPVIDSWHSQIKFDPNWANYTVIRDRATDQEIIIAIDPFVHFATSEL